MLELTERAVYIIKRAVEASEYSGGAGLRIVSLDESDEETITVDISLVEEPEADDEVIEIDEARVYLNSAAAFALEDQVLDALVGPTGDVTFEFNAHG